MKIKEVSIFQSTIYHPSAEYRFSNCTEIYELPVRDESHMLKTICRLFLKTGKVTVLKTMVIVE